MIPKAQQQHIETFLNTIMNMRLSQDGLECENYGWAIIIIHGIAKLTNTFIYNYSI